MRTNDDIQVYHIFCARNLANPRQLSSCLIARDILQARDFIMGMYPSGSYRFFMVTESPTLYYLDV